MKIFILCGLIYGAVALNVYGEVCQWNEKGMTDIFSAGSSFEKIEKELTSDNKDNLREKLGKDIVSNLTVWGFYQFKKGDQVIGFVFGDKEITEDGAIEVMIALNTKNTIQSLVVQRAPDMEIKYLVGLFLKQFVGKGFTDPFEIGDDIQINSLDYIPSKRITQGIKNQLIIFEELTKE